MFCLVRVEIRKGIAKRGINKKRGRRVKGEAGYEGRKEKIGGWRSGLGRGT
jgi:hypothetical protein